MAKHLDSEKSLDSGILSTIRVSASICESEVHQKPMPPPRYADGIPLRRPGSLSTGNLPPPTNCNATETLHPRAHQNPQDYSASGNKVLLFFEPEVLSFQNNLSNQKNGLRIKLFLLRVRPGRFLADGKDILIRTSLSILTLAAATRWVRVSARFLCDWERVAGGRPFSFGIPICRAHCMGTHPRARERGWLCPLRGREGVVTEAAGEGARAGARGVEIANAHTGCLAWDQNPVQGARQ